MLGDSEKKHNLEMFYNRSLGAREKLENLLCQWKEKYPIFIGGSIIYGIDNNYSDLDVLIIVDDDNEVLPAQTMQFQIGSTRVDCRMHSKCMIVNQIEIIERNFNLIVFDRKKPMRLGLSEYTLEALDRIANGVQFNDINLYLPSYRQKLALIYAYDRIRDFYGLYQDSIGALKAEQYIYAYSRSIACMEKNIDIYLALRGYINNSLKHRYLALKKFFNENLIVDSYVNNLVRKNLNDISYEEIKRSLLHTNKFHFQLQSEYVGLVEYYGKQNCIISTKC